MQVIREADGVVVLNTDQFSIRVSEDSACNVITEVWIRDGMQIDEEFYEHWTSRLNCKLCPKCEGKLVKSKIPDYAYECKNCDENFYSIEV